MSTKGSLIYEHRTYRGWMIEVHIYEECYEHSVWADLVCHKPGGKSVRVKVPLVFPPEKPDPPAPIESRLHELEKRILGGSQ